MVQLINFLKKYQDLGMLSRQPSPSPRDNKNKICSITFIDIWSNHTRR